MWRLFAKVTSVTATDRRRGYKSNKRRALTIQAMEDHRSPQHPGPWRVMQVDSEFAGLLVAVGFVVLGLVSMPIATGFVLGAIALGIVVALLLRFTPKRFGRVIAGMLVVLTAFALLWAGHKPRRPHTVSSGALYVRPNNLPFSLHRTGYWLECWFDEGGNVDRCRLTDENGTVSFEDEYLPCVGHTPLPQRELVFNTKWTGRVWTQSPDKRINAPVVQLDNTQTLLPRSLYTQARGEIYCSQ